MKESEYENEAQFGACLWASFAEDPLVTNWPWGSVMADSAHIREQVLFQHFPALQFVSPRSSPVCPLAQIKPHMLTSSSL